MLGKAARAVLALSLVLLPVTSADASNGFPDAIRTTLQLPDGPACTLCHNGDEGGLDTVITPFGVTMLRLGVVATNVSSLNAALLTAEAEGSDSDFDGTSDIEELRLGLDPNDGVDLPTPRTGCTFAAGPLSTRAIAIVPLALLGLLARRRRTRARSFVLAIAAAHAIACTSTSPQVEEHFELSRFAGRWYEIAKVPRDYDAQCHDTLADYRRVSPRQLDVRHTCFLRSSTGPMHEFRAVASIDEVFRLAVEPGVPKTAVPKKRPALGPLAN